MELTINKNDLSDMIQKVSGSAEKDVIIEVGEKASASTSNGIISIRSESDAEIKEVGSVCVDYKKILNFSKNYKGGTVKLKSTKAGWLHIEGDRVKLRIPGTHKENWPIISFKDLENKIEADWSDIKNGIVLTEFAVGQNVAREGLLGLNIKAESGSICFTSADGHSATRYTGKSDSEFNILIPHKSALEMMKLIDDDCQVSFNENHIQIESPSIKFKSSLLGAKFMSIDKLFASRPNRVKVNRESILSDISVLDSIISIEKDPVVKFVIHDNKIDIVSQRIDTGEGDAYIDCEYQGDEISIGVNVSLFRKAVKGFGILKDDDIIIEIGTQTTPIAISSESNEKYRTLFMPVRIEW